MEQVMSVEFLYNVARSSFRCTADLETYIIDDEVWSFDLTDKHIRHRDGTYTYFGAYLMTEKDVKWDDEFDQWYVNDCGEQYKLRLDSNLRIISRKKVRG